MLKYKYAKYELEIKANLSVACNIMLRTYVIVRTDRTKDIISCVRAHDVCKHKNNDQNWSS